MANKRSRRGQRIVSARKAAQWDEERIRRFEEEQQRKREWISFAEIAEWFSELGGCGPNEAARENAYRMLERDVLEGRFEEDGRSRVLFLHPGVSPTHGKMTAKWLQQAIENNLDNEQGRSYLRHCWLPRNLFERWCAWHHLPKSPPRFEAAEGGARYAVFRQDGSTIAGYTPAATRASSTCIDSIVRQRGPRCRDTAKQASGRQGQQVVGGSSATSRRTAHRSTCGW